MKIRSDYVSNSSSCSFLIPVDLTEYGATCFKLTSSMLSRISSMIGENLCRDSDWYLTRFVTESAYDDKIYQGIQQLEHHVYLEGDLSGEPREVDDSRYALVEVAPEVWMRPQDIDAEVLSLSAVCRRLPRGCRFLWQVENDGSIVLRPQHE